jgi:hypothetical protein
MAAFPERRNPCRCGVYDRLVFVYVSTVVMSSNRQFVTSGVRLPDRNPLGGTGVIVACQTQT